MKYLIMVVCLIVSLGASAGMIINSDGSTSITVPDNNGGGIIFNSDGTSTMVFGD